MIGIGSSAQLTPVLENNEKPKLLFLYKLFTDKGSQQYNNYSTIVQIEERTYGKDAADLILVPNSKEEISFCISSLTTQNDNWS